MHLSRPFQWVLPCLVATVLCLSACTAPQAAESRVFLNLSVSYLGEYLLPQTEVEHTQVGGLSALAYDRTIDRIYALADDRRQPRYYTLKLTPKALTTAPIDTITVESVTLLKDQQGQPIAPRILDPEGVAITPQQQVIVASEGIPPQSPPLIAGFDQKTGQWQQQLQLPPHYFPAPATSDITDSPSTDVPKAQGISENRGFEALTLSPEGDRVFTATELPLIQDVDPDDPEPQFYSRFLHYLIGDVRPLFIAEHLYPLEPPSLAIGINGLTELAALDSAGHFLSLERSYSPLAGYGAQLFQIATAGATNTVQTDQLSFPLGRIKPILKQPLLDLRSLPIRLQNLEGMMVGPTLPDGSQLLLLVSDNGFKADQPTQFLAFRLQQLPQKQR